MLYKFWQDTNCNQEQLDSRILFINSFIYYDFINQFKLAKIVAIDIETYSSIEGKEYLALDPLRLNIRLIQIAIKDAVLIVDMDISHNQLKENAEKYIELFNLLKEKGKDSNTVFLGHNLKFDLLALRQLGLIFNNVRDTMLISQILWSGIGVLSSKSKESKERSTRCLLGHSLKDLANRLGIKLDKTEQLSDWSQPILNTKQLNYAAKDVLVLFDIYDILKEKISECHGVLKTVYTECKALSAFVEIEYNGFPIDIELANKTLILYEEEYQSNLIIWQNTFNDLSPTSTKKDLIPAIKDKLTIDIVDTTDSSLGLIDNDSIKALLQMRSLNISIQYLKNVIKKSNLSKQLGLGEKIRPMFRQITSGWRTGCDGKLSYSKYNPKTGKTSKAKVDSDLYMNLQQIPNNPVKGLPNIRTVFTPSENYSLIIADLSQAHARIACEMSKDKTLTKSYNEGLDNHLLMASKILKLEGYNLEFEEVNAIYKQAKSLNKSDWLPLMFQIKEARDVAKTAFYAFLNQAGAKTMTATFSSQGVNISEEKCKELINLLREVYKDLYTFIKKAIYKANEFNITFDFIDRNGNPVNQKYGKVVNLIGSYTYYGKIKSLFKENAPDQVPYTEAIAWQWLSSEAVLIKQALWQINEKLSHLNYDAYLCGFCHDEINLVTHNDCALDVANLVGTTIKESLSQYIKSIPVEENNDYKNFIVKSLADK